MIQFSKHSFSHAGLGGKAFLGTLIVLLAFGMLIVYREGIFSSFAEVSAPQADIHQENQVILYADNALNKDEVWAKRYYYGMRTWGIRGSGKVESGRMCLAPFPRESGDYLVSIDAVFEHDGSPALRLSIDGEVLYRGQLPYAENYLDCEKRGMPGTVALGTFHINAGAQICVWGESVYECGEKGAYMLWERLRFVRENKAQP